tara:strand:- start:320 stop:550 length:231 start_codon:yes stop_codon:yes gene_type:complete
MGKVPGDMPASNAELAMQQAQQMRAQAPMPTYGAMVQTAPATGMAVNNAVTPEQLAVSQQVNGDQIQNQRAMQGLV